ncbi:MAG: protein kinase [Gammaproteobacteria bacterium]
MEIDPQQWPVLSQLLDQALDVPPSQREPWLAELPAENAPFRNVLRDLLKHHDDAETGDFLGTRPRLSTGTGGVRKVALVLPVGTVVGPYVIEEEIGRGGMGTVWRARRTDGVLKRPVALKLPHPGLNSSELIQRVARERDILAGLAHPNIARLYDAGFTEGGQPYLALEYVPGAPLLAYCDQHRLGITQRLRLFQQVLRAVQYAHGHLVVHRDIKPSNVMVGPDGQAMLLDFGIAKLTGPAAPGEAVHTQMEGVLLTPDQASPEQITGQPVTTASDIYSLGVLLFELLTGERPYRLKRVSRAALEEAILAIEPRRPSQSVEKRATAETRSTTPKMLERELRGDLDTIVLHALKKVPAERYATADAFSQDIEHYLRGEPVSARPDSAWYRARKFVARHRFPVLVGSAALAAVVVAAGIAFREAHDASVQRDRALALSSRNQAVTEFLGTLITDASGADRPVSVSEMIARSESLLEVEYRHDPEHRAAVLGMLGVHYHDVGDDARAEKLLSEALAAARTSSDADLRNKLTCDHALALAGLGKSDAARAGLQRVIEDKATSVEQSALCLEYLAYVAQDRSDAAGALKYGALALERLLEVPLHSVTQEAAFIGSIGYAQHLDGRNDEAGKSFQRSLELFATAGRERSPEAAAVRNNWAVVGLGAGDPRRALELCDETLRALHSKDPGALPPSYLVANRARALEALGRLGASLQAYGQCVSITANAASSPAHAFCLLGQASVALTTEDAAAAANYLASAAVAVGSAESAGPALTGLRAQRARLALAEGNLQAAQTLLDAALASSKGAPQTATALLVRAAVGLQDHRLSDAERDARQALELAQSAQGGIPFSNRTGEAWLTLGDVLTAAGQPAKGCEAYRSAAAHLANSVDDSHLGRKRAQALADACRHS